VFSGPVDGLESLQCYLWTGLPTSHPCLHRPLRPQQGVRQRKADTEAGLQDGNMLEL